MSSTTNHEKQVPNSIKFLFGGIAGMGATCVVQPLDLVKNRMQILGAEGGKKVTSLNVISSLVKNEGPFALYTGLSAGLLRQASYTTLVSGLTAGAVGAFVGTPSEVALIRMTADGRLPPEQKRNYSNVFNALSRIVREEGVRKLWTGCTPTIGRAMVVNMCQLASYSQAKQRLIASGYFVDGIPLHFTASMISGLITTAASMPIDIAKTRLQNMKIIDGKPEYKGTVDVLMKVIRNEGFICLWRGFIPYYARLGPHTVLTFIILEQLNTLYKGKAAIASK